MDTGTETHATFFLGRKSGKNNILLIHVYVYSSDLDIIRDKSGTFEVDRKLYQCSV